MIIKLFMFMFVCFFNSHNKLIMNGYIVYVYFLLLKEDKIPYHYDKCSLKLTIISNLINVIT